MTYPLKHLVTPREQTDQLVPIIALKPLNIALKISKTSKLFTSHENDFKPAKRKQTLNAPFNHSHRIAFP